MVEAEGLICTVSTVKDTPDNQRRFVDANLSAGADHMFVFVDEPGPEARAALTDHPHVTAVSTGPRYWKGQRPAQLNQRQHVNANLVNVVLTAVPRARWLFHLDGDECLHLDRSRLMQLDPAVSAVRLQPWEAVSRLHWDGPVTLYKRPLDEDEEALLQLIGALGEPSVRSYFRGHVRGKVGIRPHLDLKLAIHRVEGLDGALVDAFEADWLHVLHDESYDGQEFVRKWLSHISRPGSRRRDPFKQQLQAAISAVNRSTVLDEASKRELLMELYVRHVQDDAELLDRLGLLERPHRGWHTHRPRPLDDVEAGVVADMLERLSATDKDYFKCGRRGRAPAELIGGTISESRA